MPSMDHVHKYKRLKHGNIKIFRCMLADCSHYVLEKLVIGRKTICWRCGEEKLVTPIMGMQAKPHCRDCNNPEIGAAGRAARDAKSEVR